MNFPDQLKQFQATYTGRSAAIFADTVSKVYESIVVGSAITGAPGQPVQTGNLRASWQVLFESLTLARITTNVAYALAIEDGIGRYGPLKVRSPVGGFHSVKQTIAAFPRIVDLVTRQAKDNG